MENVSDRELFSELFDKPINPLHQVKRNKSSVAKLLVNCRQACSRKILLEVVFTRAEPAFRNLFMATVLEIIAGHWTLAKSNIRQNLQYVRQ